MGDADEIYCGAIPPQLPNHKRDVDWLRMTGPSAERPSDRKIKQRLRQADLRKYIIEAAKADCSIEGALESKDFRLAWCRNANVSLLPVALAARRL